MKKERAKNWTEKEYQILVDHAYVREDEHKSDKELAKEIKHLLLERSEYALECAFRRNRTFLYGDTIGKDRCIHIAKAHVLALQKRHDPALIQQRIKENEKWRIKESQVRNPRKKELIKEKYFVQKRNEKSPGK